VSLELGEADTIDNIWPQCGPKNVAVARRYFKQKDHVENFLADKVKNDVTDPRQLANIIVVPAGIVTGFASTPRALWLALAPTGRYGWP